MLREALFTIYWVAAVCMACVECFLFPMSFWSSGWFGLVWGFVIGLLLVSGLEVLECLGFSSGVSAAFGAWALVVAGSWCLPEGICSLDPLNPLLILII